jgi:hypothetical protein
MTEWRKIGEYDNYEVSSAGQVRNTSTGLVLKPQLGKKGYYMIGLSKNGKKKTFTIHKLVATAFLGDSEGREVDHKDRNRQNDSVENLRYCSRSENNKNKTGNKGVIYEYIKELPEDAVPLVSYDRGCPGYPNIYTFEFIYYWDEFLYFYNGVEYRKMKRQEDKDTGALFFNVPTTRPGQDMVYVHLNKLKKQLSI